MNCSIGDSIIIKGSDVVLSHAAPLLYCATHMGLLAFIYDAVVKYVS